MSIPTTGNPMLDLLIVLVIGFVLGWLLTGLPPRGRVRKAEERIAELETQARKRDGELGDVRKQLTSSQLQLSNTDEDLTRRVYRALGNLRPILRQWPTKTIL